MNKKKVRYSDTKSVTVYNFYNILLEDFARYGDNWLYEKKFKYKKCKVLMKLTIPIEKIKALICMQHHTQIGNNELTIKRVYAGFEITIRINSQGINGQKRILYDGIDCFLNTHNTKNKSSDKKNAPLNQDNATQNKKKTPKKKTPKKNTSQKKDQKIKLKRPKKKKKIPATLMWSVAHPFQGGACSPR